MIVQKRTTVGPEASLSFTGGEIPVGIHALKVFGQSTQATTPSSSSPVAISSVASGGTITLTINGDDYTLTVANGLKGLRLAPGAYLIGNDMYLMNNLGQKLKAKIN